METTITIDTTLISGVISAAVAILVACITVILILNSNKKLENEKYLKQKKEELFSFHLNSLSIVYYLYQASHKGKKATSISNSVIET